jgi:hypothetical protein
MLVAVVAGGDDGGVRLGLGVFAKGQRELNPNEDAVLGERQDQEMGEALDHESVTGVLGAHTNDEASNQLDLFVGQEADIDQPIVFNPAERPNALRDCGGCAHPDKNTTGCAVEARGL